MVGASQERFATLVRYASEITFETPGLEIRTHDVPVITLDFNAIVLDSATCTAACFQLTSEEFKIFRGVKEALDHRDALALPAFLFELDMKFREGRRSIYFGFRCMFESFPMLSGQRIVIIRREDYREIGEVIESMFRHEMHAE